MMIMKPNADDLIHTTIHTVSGGFDYLNPVFDIEDIAQGLAHENRYAGQYGSYTVAEHCCYCFDMAVELGLVRDQALAALLHDAQEAYLKDIPSPLKQLLPCYKEIEKKYETIIQQQFGLDHSRTKEIDNAIREWEMGGFIQRQKFLDSETAHKEFLKRYDHVCD